MDEAIYLSASLLNVSRVAKCLGEMLWPQQELLSARFLPPCHGSQVMATGPHQPFNSSQWAIACHPAPHWPKVKSLGSHWLPCFPPALPAAVYQCHQIFTNTPPWVYPGLEPHKHQPGPSHGWISNVTERGWLGLCPLWTFDSSQSGNMGSQRGAIHTDSSQYITCIWR